MKVRTAVVTFLAGCLIVVGSAVPEANHQAGIAPPGLPAAAVTFEDVAEEAGLRFQHVSGSKEKRYILEAMGSGVAWLDYNRDGWPDLYLVNGGKWSELLQGSSTVSNALYRNNGDGTFADVTRRAGVGDSHWGMGVAVGDYDNDGWDDLYLCNYGSNTLYRNNRDGTFTDVTTQAGVGDRRWNMSASFADYDNDGKVDLYVTSTVRFDHRKPPPMECLYRSMVVHCGPLGLATDPDILYRNNGDGTFTDVSEQAGIAKVTPCYGLGVVWGDYDNDGDLDIYVANDQTPNFLFRNRGDGTFEEVGAHSGAAYSDDGIAQGSMGVEFGDFDQDGFLDLFLSHFSDEYNTLYRNLGDGSFRDVSYSAEIAFPSWRFLGWGVGFVDFDNDGWEDLFVANGHLFPQINQYRLNTTYRQHSQMYENRAKGRFREVSAGLDRVEPGSSRGVACADFDKDGDVDIAVNNLDGKPWLLRNQGGNQSGHWLSLMLQGVRTNRRAIGTRATVLTEENRLVREVRGGSSYQSTHDLELHFGLGQATKVKALSVRWTDGTVQRFEDVAADRRYRLVEGGELESQDAPDG